MVFGHVDTGGAHVVLEHCYTALLLHYHACGRRGDETEGRAVFVILASVLAIFTAVLYGDLLCSLAEENSEQRAEQHHTQTH